MLEPEEEAEGEVCEAYVPNHLQDSGRLSSIIGPPVYELSEEEDV